MSTTSPDAVLSLPSGGGAVQGLGETFAPDPFTGSGAFSVPLPLPAGRGGLAPALSLVYSAGQGASAFGLGWGLSVPGVARQTRRGLPRYRDGAGDPLDHDTFVLSGAEDLVPVEDVSDGGRRVVRYRPRTEGLFARVERHRQQAPQQAEGWWEVRTPDGLTSVYGARPGTDHAGAPPVTADADRPDHVFAWHLAQTEDLLGNRVRYEYARDDSAEAPDPGAATYLERIRYMDAQTADGTGRPLVSVLFIYTARPDPFSDFRPGFEVRVRRRCSRVEVRTHAGLTPGSWDAQGTLVTSVALRYLDEAVRRPGPADPARPLDPALLPANGTSLLYQVVVTGHDGLASESLPPLTLDYSRLDPADRRFRAVEGPLPATGLSDPTLALVDLSGDGLPDILQLGRGQARVWRNRGGGRFATPRPLANAPGVGLDMPGVALLDADGDGRPDLLVADGADAGVYPVGFDGQFDRRGFRRYRTAPTVPLGDPSARLMDLSGDGVTDLLRTGDAFELFFQDADGWSRAQRVQRRHGDVFPDVDLADPRVRTARLSGGTLPDIVLVHDGNVDVWPTLGYGRWAPRRAMRHAPRLPLGYDPRRVLFGDLDGDGLDDLVYVGDGEVRVWINQGGGAFALDPIVIRGTPRVSDRSDLRIVDLTGSGTDGLLFSHDADAPGRAHYHVLDLTGGRKPYLLTGIDNGLGAVTRVAYRPSTEDFLRDAAAPATRWATVLPFPVQVVARVSALDLVAGSRLVTEYAYHHGCWDGAEREFRGFGRVDQRDVPTPGGQGLTGAAQAADLMAGRTGAEALPSAVPPGLAGRAPAALVAAPSPPVETRTWFHLGAVPDGRGGFTTARLEGEFWAGDASSLAWAGGEDVQVGTPAGPLAAFPSRAARRDALRALRGRALRTELYALDGSPLQGRPYTVTESVAGVRYEADGIDGGRVVFPYALATRTTEWDRGADPMHAFAFTGGYDAFGRPAHQTSAAVPRGRDPFAPDGTEPFLVGHGTTDYAAPEATKDAPYLHALAWRQTSYEIENDGSLPLVAAGGRALLDEIRAGNAAQQILGQTLTWYDGEAFTGLADGLLGPYGLATRSETLIITPDLLAEAYRENDKSDAAVPPYLRAGRAADDRDPRDPRWHLEDLNDSAWEVEAPDAFRSSVKDLAGYVYHDGAGAAAEGYFVSSLRARFDTQTPGAPHRGLLLESLDPAGVSRRIDYDAYGLFPASVTLADRLTTAATYEYSHLRIRETTGPNGEQTRYDYSPMGLLAAVEVAGAQGEGDTPGEPSVQHTADLRAFAEGRGPVSVTTVRRLYHASQTDVAADTIAATVTSVEYSDGFGRVVQARAQADEVVFGPAPFLDDAGLPPDITLPGTAAVGRRVLDAVTVSGHTVFDDKDRPVEQYEPYHDTGLAYRASSAQGLAVKTAYDARGRAVRVTHPDGGEERTVYGVPLSLTTPDAVVPTPWERTAYSRADNAGRTHPGDEDAAPLLHHDTPASAVVDALGRVTEQTERLGTATADEVTMRFRYDLRGNRLSTVDALGRTAWTSVYDLAPGDDGGRVWRTDHLDAGTSRTVYDAAGRAVEARDATGALALTTFDALGRPQRVWARDGARQPTTLRQRLLYGDDTDALGTVAAQKAYLLGRLWRHYDEAGLAETARYDFAGRPVEASRRVVRDAVVLALAPVRNDQQDRVWTAPDWVCDWTPADTAGAETDLDTHAATLLEARVHATATAYDALGRPRWTDLPADADGRVRRLLPTYGRGGGLVAVHSRMGGATGTAETVDEIVVERMAHDARGQRLLLALGNGTMTRYAYEPLTRRLARIRTEAYTRPATGSADLAPGADPALVYVPDGTVVQNEAYAYDLTGNVTRTQERTTDAGIAGTLLGQNALDRAFVHDALDRLTRATGREAVQAPPSPVWADPAPYGSPLPDPTAVRGYVRTYSFDAVGNVLQMKHTPGTGSAWTRTFEVEGQTNRMATLKTGQTVVPYAYDAAGRTVREASDRHFAWGADGKLRSFRTQTGTAEPSVYARYLYDAAGERVKKVVRRQGGAGHSVTEAGPVSWTRAWDASGTTVREATTTSFADETGRIAEIDAGPAEAGDSRPPVRVTLSDRLGNATVTLGGPTLANARGKVSAEGYYPYGETAWGSTAKKRYRYNGKERDAESGLYNYGARYYAAHTLRFVSVDPLWRQYPQYAPYAYAGNRPVTMVDLDGRQPGQPSEPRDDGSLPEINVTANGGSPAPARQSFFRRALNSAGRVARATGRGIVTGARAVGNGLEAYGRYAEGTVRGTLNAIVGTVGLIGRLYTRDGRKEIEASIIDAAVNYQETGAAIKQGLIGARDTITSGSADERGELAGAAAVMFFGPKGLGAIGRAGAAARSIVGASEALAAGAFVETSGGIVARSVVTPYFVARQSFSLEALAARQAVSEGATLYKAGLLGIGETVPGTLSGIRHTGAQFFALENPLSPGYASRYGMPSSSFDFVMSGTMKEGANFITRPAPPIGSNPGGAIEIVADPGQFIFHSFIIP